MSTCVSVAKIISFSPRNKDICASAARISTTKGTAIDIFEQSVNNEKNATLIENVLSSGHKSVIEHATFTIAFCNVSAYVEQFFIEFRLASYTVKSRRYVDFGSMGYYTPNNLSTAIKEIYNEHMDYLFSEYNYFVEQSIPKEDARFVLPYCFYSNFYCTVNARQLIHIINEIRQGRGKGSDELQHLANQITDQLNDIFPQILEEISHGLHINYLPNDSNNSKDIDNEKESNIVHSITELINLDKSSIEKVVIAYLVNKGLPAELIYKIIGSKAELDCILKDIMLNRPRELEHLTSSFLIKNISLSGITHIVRHRMQSIIIPDLKYVKHNKYILPESILNNKVLRKRYIDVFIRTEDTINKLNKMGMDRKFNAYFCLSGNTLDIFTTMNARELLLFFKLRCCNRAQWEIREIADSMLHQLRLEMPSLFRTVGPSCIIDGKCPEGRLSCGNYINVKERYKVKTI